jgi:hypothetical protein
MSARMRRSARSPLAVLPLVALLAACTTAASARRAELRRGLDRVRVSSTPAEIWPEVERFLHERGYPLVGDDRLAVGQKAQNVIAKIFSRGFQTRVGSDGSRVLETDGDRSRTRVHVEARPAPEGGSRLRVRLLKESEQTLEVVSEWRDEELELALLQRIDPAVAASVLGTPPPQGAAAAPARDDWAPVRPLLGAWAGALPAGAPVHWTFTFTEGGKFVEVRGSPVLFAGPAARADAGEEMGRISHEAAADRFAWSQFTAGGQVDRWRSEPSASDALVFLSEAPESLPPGSRAKLTIRRDGDGRIVAALELAQPGKDLAPAGEVRLERTR